MGIGEASAISHQPSVKRGWREPDLRLLCERCGYHLKGMRRSDVCPECGKPVVESLPERRVGSAWQRKRGFRGFLRVLVSLMEHPVLTWDNVTTRSGRDLSLLMAGSLFAVTVTILPLGLLKCWLSQGDGAPAVVRAAGRCAGFALGVAVVMLALSAIELCGITLVTRRRKWRSSFTHSLAIVSHAATMWVAGTAGIVLGIIAAFVLAGLFVERWMLFTGAAAGFLPGLLIFETLVYIGMQKMKYANAPGSERELAPEHTDA